MNCRVNILMILLILFELLIEQFFHTKISHLKQLINFIFV